MWTALAVYKQSPICPVVVKALGSNSTEYEFELYKMIQLKLKAQHGDISVWLRTLVVSLTDSAFRPISPTNSYGLPRRIFHACHFHQHRPLALGVMP
jgi:hypothetical protein